MCRSFSLTCINRKRPRQRRSKSIRSSTGRPISRRRRQSRPISTAPARTQSRTPISRACRVTLPSASAMATVIVPPLFGEWAMPSSATPCAVSQVLSSTWATTGQPNRFAIETALEGMIEARDEVPLAEIARDVEAADGGGLLRNRRAARDEREHERERRGANQRAHQ